MKKIVLIIFLLSFGYIIDVYAHNLMLGQTPRISAERIATRNIECNLSFDKVSNCHLLPGATLDNAIQEWYDLYRYALVEGSEETIRQIKR